MASRLTPSGIKKLIEKGEKKDHRDAGAPGLLLRVWAKEKWAWNLRRTVAGKDYRLDLGSVWTLDEAREIAEAADKTIRAKANPFYTAFDDETPAFLKPFIDRKLGPSAPPTPPPRPALEAAKPRSIDWEAAVEEYLAEVLRTRREDTVRSYKSCLNITEMQRFKGRMVRDIVREEMAETIDEIFRRAERQSQTTAGTVRKLFEFLGKSSMTRRTGVEEGRMLNLKAPERTSPENAPESAAVHIPDGKEIGSLMRMMRDADSQIMERDRLALELLVYSVQRRRMVSSARVGDFAFLPDGSCLWSIPPLHRKTAAMRLRATGSDGGDHVVPLPPSAACVVRRAINIGCGRKYLFPATRNRRAEKLSEHMSGETLTHLLADLKFEASPHDVRRALATTYLIRVRKMTKAQAKPLAKEILDHAEGDEKDVTTEHYLLESGTHQKWDTMRGWCSWVDEQIRSSSA